MRITVLCSDLGIRVPGTKGASLHLAAITGALAKIGHSVQLVGVAGHGPPPAGIESLLLEHPGRSVGLRRELRKLAFTEHLADSARGRIAEFGPDVIYERLALFGTAGLRLSGQLGIPHVVEVNSLLAQEESTWRGLQLVDIACGENRRCLAARICG